MNIEIILLAIFLPACILLVFSAIFKSKDKLSKTISDECFTVSIPSIVLVIGVLCAVMSVAVLLGFTFFSKEIPHFLFYCVFGLFFWLGMYLILKTLVFKVIVKGEKITVFSPLKKSYSFTFAQISSAVRQVKKNQINSERIVIKTMTGKKLIVESSEIFYDKFLKKIKLKVKKENLFGFE